MPHPWLEDNSELALVAFANPAVPRAHRAQQELNSRGLDDPQLRAQERSLIRSINNVEHQFLYDIQSPYGPVIQTLELPARRGGDPIRVQYCDPRSFIWTLMLVSPAYAGLLATSCPDGVGRTLIYMDDVRPGNIQRPENARLYYSYYLLLIDLPDWWLSSELGWLDVACVLANTSKLIHGGIASFTTQLYAAIDWPIMVDVPPHRPRPLRAPVASPGYTFSFDIIMADAKAIAQLTGASGASSYRPCACCKAVLGRLSEDDIASVGETYFQPVTCLDETKWDTITHEQFSMAAQYVRDAWMRSRREGLQAETEQSIKYNAGLGIVYSPKANVYRVPECIYWDAMHSVYASGGLAQIVCNDFMLVVLREGIPLASLQSFCEQVALPSGLRLRLGLEERLRREAPWHMRAFASEMLDVIVCLNVFSSMVLEPEGLLPDWVRGLALLLNVTVMMTCLGDRAFNFVDLFEQRLTEWLQSVYQLSPHARKPKFHYAKHIGMCLRKWRKLLTCFSAERHHRLSKQIAAWSFKHLENTIVRRMAMRTLERIQRPRAFTPDRVEKRFVSKKIPTWSRSLFTSAGLQMSSQASALHTSDRGVFRKNQFALFVTGQARGGGMIPWGAGKILGVYEATRGADVHLVVMVLAHDMLPDVALPHAAMRRFRPTFRRELVHAQRLRCALATAADGPFLQVLFPMDWHILLQ